MADPVAWLGDFATSAAAPAQVREFVAAVYAAMAEQQPRVFAEPGLAGEVRIVVQAHWRAFLAALGGARFEPTVPAAAEDLVRSMVLRGYELDVPLALYRTAQRAVWRYVTELVENRISDLGLRSAVLVVFWERASQWLDTSVEAVIAGFVAERESLRRAGDERRAAVVHELLRRGTADVDADSAALGYRLRARHRCHVLWVERRARGSAAGDDDVLDAGIEAVVRAPDVVARLVLRRGAGEAWCWVAVDGAAAPTVPDPPPGVRVATGTVGLDVVGFVRSHREALAAQAVSRAAAPAAARVETVYRDVELACLAAGLTDRDGVAAFVDRELGGLAGDDEVAVRLRETVLGYLDAGGNVRVAADGLCVHPNTIRYRVRQAEALVGHPIDDRRAHLELALRVLDAFGDTAAVLASDPRHPAR